MSKTGEDKLVSQIREIRENGKLPEELANETDERLATGVRTLALFRKVGVCTEEEIRSFVSVMKPTHKFRSGPGENLPKKPARVHRGVVQRKA